MRGSYVSEKEREGGRAGLAWYFEGRYETDPYGRDRRNSNDPYGRDDRYGRDPYGNDNQEDGVYEDAPRQ